MSKANIAWLSAISAAIAAVMLGHALYLVGMQLTTRPQERIGFIPDDTYYYLNTARHRAVDGEWTFDGVAPATGVHMLHAQILASVFDLFLPSDEGYVTFGIAYTAVLAIALAVFVLYRAGRSRNVIALLVLALMLGSRNVLLNLGAGVEWPLVVVCAALYLSSTATVPVRRSRLQLIGLFAIGCAGSLARSDFGLLPAAIAASALLERLAMRGGLRILVGSLFGLAGAVTGVLWTSAWTYLVNGQLLTGSARMKSHWLAFYGPTPYPIARKTELLLGPHTTLTRVLVALLILITIAIGIRLWTKRDFDSSDSTGPAALRVIWLASGLTILGYFSFYSMNPAGLQHWYTGNLVVPVFAFLTLPFSMDLARTVRGGLAACSVLGILIAQQALSTIDFRNHPEWPYQRYMYEAGTYLKEQRINNAAGWNSGIIGYYQGGQYTNLDGLVNDDVYEPVRANRLPSYVDQRDVEFIVDFEEMFVRDVLRRRGGYDDPAFLARLTPLKRFDERTEGWSGLTLYRLEPASIGSDAGAAMDTAD
jgi:hypothetical protein